MYGIDGRSELAEEVLDALRGLPRLRARADRQRRRDQLQLDIYGELIDSVYLYNRNGVADRPRRVGRPHPRRRVGLRELGPGRRGDLGARGGRQHFTYSRLMSWVRRRARGADRARQRGLAGRSAAVAVVARPIYHQIMARGWHEERQAFVQHYDTDVLDAVGAPHAARRSSSRRPTRAGSRRSTRCRPSSSPTASSTATTSRRRPTGCEGDEGTFSICTFWYVEALARAGRLDEARLAFEKMLTYANHLGLYSEEIGPTGEALGNFPQAFTHLALISAAFNLDRALG